MRKSTGWFVTTVILVALVTSCGGGARKEVETTAPPAEEQVAEREPRQLGWGEWWKDGDAACPAGSVLRQIERSIVCARAYPPEGGKLGQPHGRGTSFHPGGGKAAEGMFENGMHGPWTYWDQAGEEVKIERYEHGTLRRIEYVQGEQSYQEALWLLCNSVLLSGARRISDQEEATITNAQWIEQLIENPEVEELLSSLDVNEPETVQARIRQEVQSAGIPQCPLLEGKNR